MGKYSDSPDWADVTPIPLDEPVPHPLASIAYSDEYAEAMSYLRAVLKANDTSARVLGLTADLIKMNPSHYTVWIHRAKTLQAQRVPYKTELEFLEPLSLKHLKNYQIWQHRQTIAGALTHEPDGAISYEHEAAFMSDMLDRDAKNYHVWVYRHWLVEKLDLFGDARELAAVDELLDDDVRNNSAWSHRWLLVFGVPEGRGRDEEDEEYGAPGWKEQYGEDEDDEDDWVDEPDEAGEAGETAGKDAGKEGEPAAEKKPKPADVPRPAAPEPLPSARAAVAALASPATVAREAAYAMARVRLAPQNESPWNYLRALHTIPAEKARLPADKLRTFAEEFADLKAGDGEHLVGFEDRVPLRGSPWYGGVDLGPKPGIGGEVDTEVGRNVTLPVRVKKTEDEASEEESKGEASEDAKEGESEKGDEKKMPVRSSHALDILALLLEKEEPEMAVRALDLLATRYDPIRANYWNWRKSAIVLPAKGKKTAA